LGKFEEALELSRKAVEMMSNAPLPVYVLCFALVAGGHLDEAREIVKNMEETARETYVGTYFLAMTNLAIGETDKTFYYLQKAIDEKNHWLLWLGTEPKLDSIRGEARFDRLYERDRGLLTLKPKRAETKAETKKTVAVLPFKLIGAADADDEFLSVGLADALIMRFSNIRKFIVRPTSVVLSFGNAKIDPFEAGRQLDAEYVVDGTIRRVGDRIRVTAQLLNVRESATAWSFPFDEKYTDVLALEDSISEKVAKSILPQFSDEDEKIIRKRGTNDPHAFEAFMKGRFHWNSMTAEGFAKAIQFYEKAVALDPHYALAYVSIAEYYIHLGIQCLMPFAEGTERAKEAAEKAVRSDPTLADAYAALGFTKMNADYDWQGGFKNYERAVQINPNSVLAHFWLETYYIQNCRYEEALAELEKALAIEPKLLVLWHNLAWVYFNCRRFEDSIKIHQQIIETNAAYPFANLSYSWVLCRAGRFDEAIEQARRGFELAPENPMYRCGLASAFAAAGKNAEAEEILSDLAQISNEKYVSPYMLATVYISLGDKDKALELLKNAAEIRDTWIVWLAVNPQFDALRDDARYEEILRLIKHPLAKN
jgi:TolB-like protein/predicted Zn-dependent protease